MKMHLRILTAMLLVLATGAPALGAVLEVPGTYPTIAAGLADAEAGDTVLVAAGTYFEHDLILPSGVILRGATGDPADVVIDGQRLGRCIYGADLEPGTRIEAVTLFNGLPAYGATPRKSDGAGLMVEGGSPTVVRCIFRGNETAVGGGAFISGTGSPRFEDCLFVDNSATEDSGMFLYGVCDPVLVRCTFTGGNRCMYGGGLGIAISGQALLEQCVFENNTVLETGGGLEVYGGGNVTTLRNCLIRNNHADLNGGGLIVGNYGQVVLDNCTITGNSAGQGGGGVDVSWYSRLEGEQATIMDNTAPIGPDGGVASYAVATLTCCEVDSDAWWVAGTFSLDNDGCGVGDEPVSWGEVKSLFR